MIKNKDIDTIFSILKWDNSSFRNSSCRNHVYHNEALLQKLYVAVTDLDRMMMSGNLPQAKCLT